MGDYYSFKNIRMLLTEGFSEDELLDLCFDVPVLRRVYDNRSGSSGKSELVRSIIDHAHRRLELEAVLKWAEDHNPSRYEAHRPYDQLSHRKDQNEPLYITSVLPDNDLGKGITLGGTYRGIPLGIVATDWTEYGATWVRSGWLFIPQWTENHAIAFFKIHTFDGGQGYIHIVDVSDPAHTIWLTTKVGFNMEREFHYVSQPADVWQFVWR